MQSTIDAFSDTVTQGCVMQSDAFNSSGFRPSARARIVLSRSVIAPIGRIDSRLSTTGISPQSQRSIMRATSCNGVSGVQHVGLLVINSRTCMLVPQWTSRSEKWDYAAPEKVTSFVRNRPAWKVHYLNLAGRSSGLFSWIFRWGDTFFKLT